MKINNFASSHFLIKLQLIFLISIFLIPFKALAAESDGSQEVYFAIKNRWNNAYLFDSNGYLYYKVENPTNDTAYQWSLIRKDGEFYSFKNRKTGNLINTEYQKDGVQSDKSCPANGDSCKWALEKATDGYIRFRSGWHYWEYMHVQDLKGYVQRGRTYPTWESAQWMLSPVTISTVAAKSPNNPQIPAQPATVAKPAVTPANTSSAGASQSNNGQLSNSQSYLAGMYINIQDYGAKGDGRTDNQTAIQNAINSAKSQGKAVFVPTGIFNHSGVIVLDSARMTGAGDGSVLHATNPDRAAIKLTGNEASLSALKVTVVAPQRSSMPDAAAVLIQQANGASVIRMLIQGACSNGIRVDNSTKSVVINNLVYGTNADGIALMNGAIDNRVEKNVVYQAGDDSYSDNSYQGDARQDDGNSFIGNLALDNAYGRGVALAGSKNDLIKDNTISGSKWMGIYAAGDHDSGTLDSSGHKIQNNTVINSPYGPPVFSNGAGIIVSGTVTTGNVPSLSSILGWDPGRLPDRFTFNPSYRPGTGSGANNTAGNRS